jgi:hypothetical protein
VEKNVEFGAHNLKQREELDLTMLLTQVSQKQTAHSSTGIIYQPTEFTEKSSNS